MTSVFKGLNFACMHAAVMLSRAHSRCARVTRLSLFRSLATEAAEQPAKAPLLTARPRKLAKPQISTAIVLNRSPTITRTPTLFEKAYYAYQQRIRRALHNPFPYEFYFKQGTLLETRFTLEERKRERLAFGPGFLEKEDISEEKRAANIAAVEQLAQQEGEGEVLLPRKRPADESGDLKSLDRAGTRNLYLLLQTVENGKDVWRFPQGELEKDQFLHQAALKDLYAECGDQMDTWIVGKTPIGVYQSPQAGDALDTPDRYVFFFKAHILAGQVHPVKENIKAFAWLTKEEIEPLVDKCYWDSIKDILSDH